MTSLDSVRNMADMPDPNATESKPQPGPILGTVSMGALADALGISRSSVIRAVKDRTIPDAEFRTGGGHRRWKIATAAKIVRKAKRPVPAAWGSP